MVDNICKNKNCNKLFPSSKPKIFCSRPCYFSSDEFRAMIAANMAKGREKGRGPKRQGEYRKCEECDKQIYLNATAVKRNKKTCSRLCYRAYMAKRFDRYIGHVENINDLSNYDEFLSQSILSCLIDGCEWKGHNLSLHMNLSHAIKEEEFKRAAGFNLTSGVVSAAMHTNLIGRGNRGGYVDGVIARAARKFDYTSRESSEHRAKGRLLRNNCVNETVSELSKGVEMKVYTCKILGGVWPSGMIATVVSTSKKGAKSQLEKALLLSGLGAIKISLNSINLASVA